MPRMKVTSVEDTPDEHPRHLELKMDSEPHLEFVPGAAHHHLGHHPAHHKPSRHPCEEDLRILHRDVVVWRESAARYKQAFYVTLALFVIFFLWWFFTQRNKSKA